MGRLPKHLRPRWRYLAVELETRATTSLVRDTFQNAIWQASRSLLGDLGSARISLDVLRFSHRDGRGTAVIRVHRGTENEARAVLATLGTVGNEPIRATVRGVSGTIRACEENYLRIARESQSHEVIALDDVKSPAFIRSKTVDLLGDSTLLGATTLDIR